MFKLYKIAPIMTAGATTTLFADHVAAKKLQIGWRYRVASNELNHSQAKAYEAMSYGKWLCTSLGFKKMTTSLDGTKDKFRILEIGARSIGTIRFSTFTWQTDVRPEDYAKYYESELVQTFIVNGRQLPPHISGDGINPVVCLNNFVFRCTPDKFVDRMTHKITLAGGQRQVGDSEFGDVPYMVHHGEIAKRTTLLSSKRENQHCDVGSKERDEFTGTPPSERGLNKFDRVIMSHIACFCRERKIIMVDRRCSCGGFRFPALFDWPNLETVAANKPVYMRLQDMIQNPAPEADAVKYLSTIRKLDERLARISRGAIKSESSMHGARGIVDAASEHFMQSQSQAMYELFNLASFLRDSNSYIYIEDIGYGNDTLKETGDVCSILTSRDYVENVLNIILPAIGLTHEISELALETAEERYRTKLQDIQSPEGGKQFIVRIMYDGNGDAFKKAREFFWSDISEDSEHMCHAVITEDSIKGC